MSEFPLDQVRTLLAVVDEGTFEAAAAALHVTPSAISQRVKALEQRVGRVLLIRSKPAQPTESGQVLVRLARQIAALDEQTQAELGIAPGPGGVRLSIAVNADSLATWFLPALMRLPREEQVCFELHREDEGHTAALLREGRVMAAVTSSPEPVAGCTVRPLGHARYVPAASPAFVERHLSAGPLKRCLAEAPVVAFDHRDQLQDRFVRAVTGGTAGASGIRHLVPTSEGFRDAVAAGFGWGMVPESQAAPLLSSGALTKLAAARHVDVPLYWQQWKLDVPALARVAAAVAAEAADSLHRGKGEPSLRGRPFVQDHAQGESD
ncbi:LysR family transcriptional regulator ArgP [Labedaea rhizosphaerae]|uniref:HTH-type transcriptional regulator LysG n=1 Tax=Labedaea rhizosphaerae TaxID=598644 RepID=A0A4R6SFH7_LABRH|nr:LysR family transcriptional regulator ArgP [Labedaea rhizosphaerae]TDQ00260.1 LysR family transcriptional regulator (chromosome initiation inhibitor) [Labedaea rhizosphaerae]